MVNDLRYAFRNLAHAPGFSAVIVLTLALGIGANTAIFSVVNVLLFDSLPYPNADRLYAVTFEGKATHGNPVWSYPKYAAFAQEQGSFDITAAFARQFVTIRASDTPERVETEAVTPTYFPMLGINAAQGRVFRSEEGATPGEAAVIVISDRLWRRQFGADPAIVGKTVGIKDRQYEIVGVAPAPFRGQSGTTEMWLTVTAAEHAMFTGAATAGASSWLRVLARLKAGTTIDRARSEMPALVGKVDAVFFSRMARGDERYQLVPFKETKLDPQIGRSFMLLLGAVGFVLLIACANTANLLLGRAVARQKEFAVRRALGAGRTAIVRQVVFESLLLSAAAGAAGLLVAMWTIDWLTNVRLLGSGGVWTEYVRTFEYFSVSLEPRALAFNGALALVVGFVFGIAPAWHASRTDLNDVLKRSVGASAVGFRGVRGLGARAALVLTEIAFSLVLLVAAGLMIKSFARASSADLGFDPNGLVTMATTPSARKPVAFYTDLLQRIQAIPGVERAALSLATPLGAGGYIGPIKSPDRAQDAAHIRGMLNVVTPDFFSTYRMRMLHGRPFNGQDTDVAPRVAIVTRALAETAWPGESAIGKRVQYDLFAREPLEVVGVVDEATYRSLEEPTEPILYVPVLQLQKAVSLMPPTSISIRTAIDTAAIVKAVRGQIQSVDAIAPVYNAASMRELAARVTSRYRYGMLMMGAMAMLALGLAGIGTYGVIAYAVALRTREIGIRMALGAKPGDVLALVVGGGLRLAAAGIVIGLAGAAAASRLLGALLFGVSPGDPATYALIAVLMAAVASLASYLPARRAMRVDPAVALRTE